LFFLASLFGAMNAEDFAHTVNDHARNLLKDSLKGVKRRKREDEGALSELVVATSQRSKALKEKEKMLEAEKSRCVTETTRAQWAEYWAGVSRENMAAALYAEQAKSCELERRLAFYEHRYGCLFH
jgi:hypothetical protein